MPLHVHEQIEVAARRAPDPGLALPGDADPGAFVDSGGNFDRQLALVECPAFAVTIGARIGDHFAGAAARRAAALDHEKALLRADFAHASAGLAGIGAAIRLRASAPMAQLARCERYDRDRLFDAGK